MPPMLSRIHVNCQRTCLARTSSTQPSSEIAVTCTRAGAPGLYLTDMQDHGQRKCSVGYLLPLFLAPRLDAAEYFKRRYIPNDPIIINAIKTAFLQLDFTILDYAAPLIQQGGPLAHVVSGAAHAFSGSCALLALYDPTHSVLRLANVGDSRAVLGRWNGTKYVCEPMSVDHTGFNPDEVSRLQREHPGEHGIVDPRSGRVHGLATSRAFGDS